MLRLKHTTYIKPRTQTANLGLQMSTHPPQCLGMFTPHSSCFLGFCFVFYVVGTPLSLSPASFCLSHLLLQGNWADLAGERVENEKLVLGTSPFPGEAHIELCWWEACPSEWVRLFRTELQDQCSSIIALSAVQGVLWPLSALRFGCDSQLVWHSEKGFLYWPSKEPNNS